MKDYFTMFLPKMNNKSIFIVQNCNSYQVFCQYLDKTCGKNVLKESRYLLYSKDAKIDWAFVIMYIIPYEKTFYYCQLEIQ